MDVVDKVTLKHVHGPCPYDWYAKWLQGVLLIGPPGTGKTLLAKVYYVSFRKTIRSIWLVLQLQ